jgi:hypothetical protein
MLDVLTLASVLAGVNADFIPALEALFRKHREEGSGDPSISLQAEADLNGDKITDGVIIFAYGIGPNMDKSHPQYLTIVSSSPEGYVTSWPVLVGTAGTRYIQRLEIHGTEIVLYGDFTVWDGTASMAHLPATGEIRYLYRDGVLREQGGAWTRKSDE